MVPTSYCLGPMLYSSSDVSRIVGNETRPDDYSNRMLPRHTNGFRELIQWSPAMQHHSNFMIIYINILRSVKLDTKLNTILWWQWVYTCMYVM